MSILSTYCGGVEEDDEMAAPQAMNGMNDGFGFNNNVPQVPQGGFQLS